MFRESNRARGLALATSSALALSLALGPTLLAAPARAQDEASPTEAIVVTGSRIVRRDYEANSPIVTVESEALENRSGVNIESYLNQLPQFNPATTPTTTEQDVQITAVNSVGIATVSLRGLGANRNLVLVDGHRPTPINALMVTDINSIPSALIQRVETISGGASAVYGADAVGGVVNFILKDDFEGLEVDSQYGMTEAGDGEEFRISAVAGANLADGRGNVSLGLEHYSRSIAYEKNRDFFTDAWSDPYSGSDDFFVFGYNGYNTGFSPPAESTINAVFSGLPAGTSAYPYGTGGYVQGYRFNPDGSLWFNGPGLYKYQGPVDGQEYALQNSYSGYQADGAQGVPTTTLKWNNQDAYASAPQTRYSVFGSANYDITDNLTFFARGTFAESTTKTRLFPANASFGWETQVPYNPTTDSPFRLDDPLNPGTMLNYGDPAVVSAILANPSLYANPSFIASGSAGAQHPVTDELAILLNSRGALNYCDASGAPGPFACSPFVEAVPTTDPSLVGTWSGQYGAGRSGPWVMETYPKTSFNDRATTNVNEVWQLEAGLRGDLPIKDWTWEGYVSHGESSTYNVAYGNNSLERFRLLVQSPDYGRGQHFAGNEEGLSTNFGAAIGDCTSGFYDTIFMGDARPTDDCLYLVEARLQSRTQNEQNIAELNFEGGLFDLPAGEVRGAWGFQYRENEAKFYPDILQSTASLTDQVIGVYPTAYMDASISAQDYFVETLVPVVKDLPFVQDFSLELGARYSEYSDVDSAWTYKALGDWSVNDWLRLRGGYNRATRAPNIGELFLGKQEFFSGGGEFGDPCGLRSNSPFGAGGVAPDPVLLPGEAQTSLAGGQTAAGAQSTYLICQAQMGQAATNYFYSQDAGGGVGGGFAWLYQEGNPDLESEVADTWTFGGVVTSPFENPWLAGLTGSVDWYKISIDDAIQQQSIDYARFLCYGTVQVTTPEQAAAQAATEACQNVGRTQGAVGGGAASMLVRYDNLATIETSGVDVAVNWLAQLGDLGLKSIPGGVGVNVQASFLDYYKTKASPEPFDVEIDWVDSLGPTLSGTDAGAYEYRLFTTFSYFLGDDAFSLRWRHLPEVWDAGYASQKAIYENNLAVVGGADGMLLSYTPGTFIKNKAYDVFDFSANLPVNEAVSLRFGVDNVLDTKPVTTGRTAGYPAGSNWANVCQGAPGCVNPTGPSLPNWSAGTTNGGFYDVLGRRYFVGVKLTY